MAASSSIQVAPSRGEKLFLSTGYVRRIGEQVIARSDRSGRSPGRSEGRGSPSSGCSPSTCPARRGRLPCLSRSSRIRPARGSRSGRDRSAGRAALKSPVAGGEGERAVQGARVEDVERQVVVARAELQIVVALLAGQEPRERLVDLIRGIHAPVRARGDAVLERLDGRAAGPAPPGRRSRNSPGCRRTRPRACTRTSAC